MTQRHRHQSMKRYMAVKFLLAVALMVPIAAHAQSTMSEYTTTTPLVSNSSVPNVLLVLDNSGSMNTLATFDPQKAFTPNASFSGYFDPTKCYQYDGSNKIFVTTMTASTVGVGGLCNTDQAYEWSGSLLNYVSMRRRDIARWVLTGGHCEGGRHVPDGTCPSKILLGVSNTNNHSETVQISQADAIGRMPAKFTVADPVYFNSLGTVATLTGSFCVNDYYSLLYSTRVTGSPPASNHPVSACPESWGNAGQPPATYPPGNAPYPNEGFQVRVQSLTEPTGVIQQVGTRVRLGLMQYNKEEGGQVLFNVGENINGIGPFLNTIENDDGAHWTVLAETLYEAVRYFAQLPPFPDYDAGGPGTPNSDKVDAAGNLVHDYVPAPGTVADPYFHASPWAAEPGQSVPCCKSYVIMFTDGEPTHDQNIPAAIQNLAGAPPPFPVGVDEQGNTGIPDYLANVAYYAHTTDLRSDLLGKQSLTIYTAFMFGQPSDILKAAAKYGGFDTTNGNNPNATSQDCTMSNGTVVPNGSSPLWDKLNNATGLAGPDCLPDTYFDSANAAIIKDQMQRIFNITESQAGSASSSSVLGSSSSGEGATFQASFIPDYLPKTCIPGPCTSGVDEVALGAKEIRWLGYTQGLFVDGFGHLREDSDGNGRLDYKIDKIVVMRFDTSTNTVLVDRFSDNNGDGMADPTIDTNGDGTLDTATPFDTVPLTDLRPIWEAGRRLALTPWDTRKILTWVDANNNGRVDAGEFIPFDQTNSATLAPYLRAGAAPFDQDNIVKFIRGYQATAANTVSTDPALGLRDRQKIVDGNLQVWKLGDIVHSSPVVVAAPNQRYDVVYGDTSYSAYYIRYKDRRQVVYAGANDGMLHAFNAGFYTAGDDPTTTTVIEHGRFDEAAPTSVSAKYASMRSGPPKRGDELWGFIPYQLLPQLQWLMRQDYTHVDYVDLPPRFTDARIFTPDTDHPNGWGTILIGGMRFGGSCGKCETVTGGKPMTIANFNGTGQDRTFYSAYFVLDITNPEKDPVLLWSFSNADLGLTSALPTVVRVNPADQSTTDNAFARWFMAVGSGATTYTGSSTQTGKIFVIDLATGLLEGSPFSSGDSNASMGDAISVDTNLDFRVDVVYLGSSIDNGPGTPQFKGKLYRLTLGGCSIILNQACTTANWGIASGAARAPTVLLATFPPGNTPVGPVTAASTVSIDTNDAFWVYWGTGRFYTNADATNTDTQYFFGVKDAVVTGGCNQNDPCSQSNRLVNVSNAVVSTDGAVTGVTTPGGVPITNFDALKDLFGNPAKNVDGWYIILPGLPAQSGKPPLLGERTLSRPAILGGTLFFTTFTPSGDFCDSAGHGRLYALFFTTGSAFQASSLGTDPTVGANKRFQDLGKGLPSQAALQMGARGTSAEGIMGTASGCSSGVTAHVQASSATQTVCAKVALRSWSAIISWRDL